MVFQVKVELIDNQEFLKVSNYNHSIRIPLTAEFKAEIDAILDAPMDTSKRAQDINGTEVTILKAYAN